MLYRLSVHLQWKYLTTDEYIRIFPILRFKNCQLKKSNLININKAAFGGQVDRLLILSAPIKFDRYICFDSCNALGYIW